MNPDSALNKAPPYLWWTLIILVYATAAILLTKFSDIHIFTGDIESARYLLSALSQSMAAIFALFFSITLITLQTFGSRYTTRVYTLFFDRWFLSFISVFIFDIIWIFVTLGSIKTELTPRGLNAIDSSLIMSITLLLILIPFIYRTKEILKPETIIKAIKEEASVLITKGIKENNPSTKKEYFDDAINKIDILRDISLKAALNRELSLFRFAVRKWQELFEISENTSVYSYLENTFPDTFGMVATIDETMAIQGLDELGNIIRKECEALETERAKLDIERFSRISSSLLEYPEIVIVAMVIQRNTAQIYMEKVPEITFEINRLFSIIGSGSDNLKVQQKSIHEIQNVFHRASRIKVEDEKIKANLIISSIESIDGISKIGLLYGTRQLEDGVINDILFHLINSLILPKWKLDKQESRKVVLDAILPLLEVNERAHVYSLIRVGATVEDQETRKAAIESIKKFLVRINQKQNWLDRAFKEAKKDTPYSNEIDKFRKNFE